MVIARRLGFNGAATVRSRIGAAFTAMRWRCRWLQWGRDREVADRNSDDVP